MENFTHVAYTGQNAGVWTQVVCSILHKMAVSRVSDRPASSIRGQASQPITEAGGLRAEARLDVSVPVGVQPSAGTLEGVGRRRPLGCNARGRTYTRPFFHFRVCGYRRAAACILSLYVDLVGAADGDLQFEPFDVAREVDLARDRSPDQHRPGRAAVGRVLVGILRDVDDRQLVAAPLERLGARRDVISATGMGVKRHMEQVVGT